MSKKYQDMHKCPECGRPFEYKDSLEFHREKEHAEQLSSYDDDLKKFSNMNQALHKNDYDKAFEPTKSKQTGLNKY